VINNDTSYHHDYPGWDVTQNIGELSGSKGPNMYIDATGAQIRSNGNEITKNLENEFI
jgi:hypothetical protein